MTDHVQAAVEALAKELEPDLFSDDPHQQYKAVFRTHGETRTDEQMVEDRRTATRTKARRCIAKIFPHLRDLFGDEIMAAHAHIEVAMPSGQNMALVLGGCSQAAETVRKLHFDG